MNDTSASLIIAQMLFLEAQDTSKDIQFYINSPGGLCVGLAASFGAFLLAGGIHAKRMALPNAEIMLHQPAMHGNGIQGPASDIKIMSDYMQKNKRRLNRILA